MPNPDDDPVSVGDPTSWDHGGVYEIRVKGLLDAHWQRWFEGMILEAADEDGQSCTRLVGRLADQPALHGLLTKIRDLNLTLVSVRRIAPSDLPGLEGMQKDG